MAEDDQKIYEASSCHHKIFRENPCNSVSFPALGAVVGVEAVEVARGGLGALYPKHRTPNNTLHPDPCSFQFESLKLEPQTLHPKP